MDAITDISESYVISFNYTHTPNKLYNISLEKTHFIHGEIDLSRQKSEINTMVFGIEDKEIDVNSSLIPYQKYYQRIVKETGSEYLDFLSLDIRMIYTVDLRKKILLCLDTRLIHLIKRYLKNVLK